MCIKGDHRSSLIHILPGESDNHLFFMLCTWFYIHQSCIVNFKRKRAYITENLVLSQKGGSLGFEVPLKKSKIVISTFLSIIGQNKSQFVIFGHVTQLSGIFDNHFGWRHPGYQHTRGLIK